MPDAPHPAPGAETEAPIAVQDGTVLTFDVLRWNEGWDFDCPVCVLRPVVVFSPNGEHADELVERVCESACLDGHLRDDGTESGLVDRAFPYRALKRRWAAAWRGAEYPVKQYEASRIRVRFFAADGGELDFEAQEITPTSTEAPDGA